MDTPTHIEISVKDEEWWVASIHVNRPRPPIEIARVQVRLIADNEKVRDCFVDLVHACAEHMVREAGGKLVEWSQIDSTRVKLN